MPGKRGPPGTNPCSVVSTELTSSGYFLTNVNDKLSHLFAAVKYVLDAGQRTVRDSLSGLDLFSW